MSAVPKDEGTNSPGIRIKLLPITMESCVHGMAGDGTPLMEDLSLHPLT